MSKKMIVLSSLLSFGLAGVALANEPTPTPAPAPAPQEKKDEKKTDKAPEKKDAAKGGMPAGGEKK